MSARLAAANVCKETDTRNAERKRALCLECQRTFTLSPKGPRYDQKFKDQVISA